MQFQILHLNNPEILAVQVIRDKAWMLVIIQPDEAFVILLALLSCEQHRPLVDYAPKSSQEQALKNLLLIFQEAVVEKDSKKIEKLLHESASIMIGSDRKILSKSEYVKILPERLSENSSILFGTPKMSVSGDKAEIRIYMSRGGGNFLIVFNMVMESNTWYISSWKY